MRGTEKQTVWATKIQSKALPVIDGWLKIVDAAPVEGCEGEDKKASAIKTLLAMKEIDFAPWWIEKRAAFEPDARGDLIAYALQRVKVGGIDTGLTYDLGAAFVAAR